MRIRLSMSRLLAVGLFASLISAACSRGIEGAYATLPPVGTPLPSFAYPALPTGAISSGGLAGAPAVIALWSSHCSASREALGAIAALRADYAARGVRVVLLADDAEPSALGSLLSGIEPGLPVALAAGALTQTFSRTTLGPWRRPLPLPTFLLVDGGGRVVHRQVGVEQAPAARLLDLRRRVDTLLAGAPGV